MVMSWQYIAGFLDGEGCISLCPNRGRPMSTNLQIAISQTGTEGFAVLSEIKEFLAARGIKSYLRRNNSSSRRRKSTYREMWMLSMTCRPSTFPFLKSILPYLHVKKVKAQDCLRYLIMFPDRRGFHFRELNAKRKLEGWHRPFKKVDEQAIISDRKSGMTVEQIQSKHKVGWHILYKRLKVGKIRPVAGPPLQA